MSEENNFFTPEQVDEQIEQCAQVNAFQPEPTAGTHLIQALRQSYQQEAEQDARSLNRAWERIEAARHLHSLTQDEERKIVPVQIQETGQPIIPGKAKQREPRPLWRRLQTLAAVALIALTVGSMLLVFHAASSTGNGVIGADGKIGTTIYTYTKETGGILSLDWSPDGKYIASCGDGLQVWNAFTGKRLFTFSTPNTPHNAFFVVRWSPNGKRIAAGNGAGQVYVLNATNGHLLRTFTYQLTTDQSTVKRQGGNPDDVVMTSRQFEPASGGPAIFGLAWSPDSTYIASTPPDQFGGNAVVIWNATSGKIVTKYTGHTAPVDALSWSPNGKYIVSAGDGIADRTVRVWNALTGQTAATYRDPALGQHDAYAGVAWSPNGYRIASYDDNGTVQVWQALTGKQLVTIKTDGANHLSSPPLSWSPDGQRIVTAGDSVQIWDASSGKLLFPYTAQTVPTACPTNEANIPSCVRTVAWSPDGKYIASGSDPNVASEVKVWLAGN